MKCSISESNESACRTGVLILPAVHGKAAETYKALDKAAGGVISAAIRAGEFTGRHGETCLVRPGGGVPASRLMLLGLGKPEKLDAEALRRAGGRAESALGRTNHSKIAMAGRAVFKLKLDPAHLVEGYMLGAYEFTSYKSRQEDSENKRKFPALTLLAGKPEAAGKIGGLSLQARLRKIAIVAGAVHFARDLVNTPPNDMTPTIMLKAARALKGVSVRVIDRREAERLGMAAYLSVANGSKEPPRFIVLTYKGGRPKDRPVAIIGKSITFDSGGLSLKPAASMETMKYDMAGGAAALGAMKACVALGLRINLCAVLPATENLPSESPTRPGDVVRSIGGKTIEILNTDAEGRLALADALGYVRKHVKPSEAIDLATLTGACSVAFGEEAIALMGNDEDVLRRIEAASAETGERAWRMPLYDDYLDYIKSPVADLQNISKGRNGGLVTSGYFLKEFAEDMPWAHLDIAGTAWTDKARPYMPRGGTGIGVRLLVSYLCARARG